VKKPWKDSELARLSAYLDRQLAATLDRLELGGALNRKAGPESDDRPADGPWAETSEADGPWAGIAEADLFGETDEPKAGARPAGGSAARLAGKHFLAEDLSFEAAPGPESPFPGSPVAKDEWLEPELLGEPEVSVGLTPEAVRELSRIIEAAVEKGVAAALAKLKD